MKRVIKKFKKPIVFFPALLVVLVAIPTLAYFAVARQNGYETYSVKRGNVFQEFGISGKVKPAESVDLAFEKSGRIAGISVKVGDKILAGQALLNLENSEVSAQLAQALAEVQIEEANLNETKKGTRPEEIQIQETKMTNLKVSLACVFLWNFRDFEFNLKTNRTESVLCYNNKRTLKGRLS